MTFCTQNVQTAGLLDCLCLFLDFFAELFVQFLIYGSCVQHFLIVCICIADCFCNDFFRIFPLPHFCLGKEFGITTQHNIRTTTSHIGGNGNCTQLTSLCNDLCFLCVILCVQDFVLDALSFQHAGEQFRFFNGNGTYQNRLSLFMTLSDLLNDCLILALFSAVDQVGVVDTLYRTVGRDRDNVQLVDLTEFVFLCHCSTGHTGQLGVQAEVVLECDGCQRLGFLCDLYTFLGFDCLMQTVIETTAQHLTTGEFVDDDNFAVLYDIVNVFPHDTICLQCLIDMVQQGHVFRIHQVFDCKIFLCLLDTAAGNGCSL